VAEGYGWKPYRCPFHGDRDASGSVNSQKQVFNCHAADCPKGNAVQVIMQWEQVTFREAVEEQRQYLERAWAEYSPYLADAAEWLEDAG